MMPTEPVLDIMRRTIANLAFIEQHAGVDGPYKTTQLINSFLGALAHPWEDMKPELNALSIDAATERGWPAVRKEQYTDADPSSVGDLLRYLRNSLAHGNIDFLPRADRQIGALRVWNNDRGNRTWGAIVSVDDLRNLLHRFVDLVEEIHAANSWRGRKRA